MSILLIIGFIKFAHQVLYAVYLLQLKEYRHDRLREHLLRKHKYVHHALFHTGLGAPISLNMLPRPTGKAVLIILFSLLLGVVLIYVLGLAGVVMALLFSLGIVLLSLSVIAPIEHIMRQSTYKAARAKIMDYKSRGLVVVGITGSYGKTSTKDFLAYILSSSFPVLATQNSINTPLGVARTILNELHPKHKVFIVEMGAYKIGEISELCDIAIPDMAIITGISNQHISLFGSQENIIRGKSELFDKLKPNSTAYINARSPHQHNSSNSNITIVSYTEDLLPKDLQEALQTTKLPGELRQNIIPGILIAQQMGMSTEDIERSLHTLAPSEKTMKITEGKGGASIIDDSHNASEMGVATAISFLNSLPHKDKIIIMPCIIELGDDSEDAHKHVGDLIKATGIEAVITTNDYFDFIAETAPKNKVHLIEDPKGVCEFTKGRLNKDCAVVLEGKIHPDISVFVLNK